MFELLQSALLGVVEGLTEFIPVSSTGHLILAGRALGFDETRNWAEVFYVAIQSGAILAVCWHYRQRLWALARGLGQSGRERRLALNVILAFLPAAALGVALSELIQERLFNVQVVAAALIAGGVVILALEWRLTYRPRLPRVSTIDDLTWRDALAIGLAQCLALIPGVSRSGATIIGGMASGLSRLAATEFSFFLAIPTVLGAAVWDLCRHGLPLSWNVAPELAVGLAFSLLSAIAVVRWLLSYVSRRDFRVFGWYRIAFGLAVVMFG